MDLGCCLRLVLDFCCFLRHILDFCCFELAQFLLVVSVLKNFCLARCLCAMWSKSAAFVVGMWLIGFPAKFASLTCPETVCCDEFPLVVADEILDVKQKCMNQSSRIGRDKSSPGKTCSGFDALKIGMVCFVTWAGFQRVLELKVGAQASVFPDGLLGHRHLFAMSALAELALRDA